MPSKFRFEWLQNRKWIGNICTTPAGAGLGNLKIATRSGAAALNRDTRLSRAQKFSRLMFREYAGDVIVHHHDVVHFAEPLFREHANRRGTAADAHPLFTLAVDDRRLSGGNPNARALVNREFDFLAVAKIKQRFAGDAPFALAAAGEVMHATQ